MSVQYLVDYENVHESGIYGLDALSAEDCVYLFHTSTTEKITLSTLDDVRAWVKVILVPPGKQSLDMHLSSFLGYLIGKETDPDTKYAIVSHDTDYRGITDFWNSSFQMSDKVQCISGISSMLASCDMYGNEIAAMGAKAEWNAIRAFLAQVFSKHGFISRNRMPCMRVSELCMMLNGLPAYNNARKRTGKKPLQFLMEDCRDILWVDRKWNQDWVYFLGGAESDDDTEEYQKKLIAEETVQEEDEPDIMDMGDLNIDDDPAPEEMPAAAEPASEETAEQSPQEEEEPDLLAVAIAGILNSDTERNAAGHVRASALRDELMTRPDFRIALKESGLKPILFMQQLFPDHIRIYREKGIYWAAAGGKEENGASPEDEGKDPVIRDRQKSFYEQASANIRKRLADAGLEQNVADEIADICMHSYASVEPRKVIHNLLCQRYGTKIGVQYYRKAVKYVDIA